MEEKQGAMTEAVYYILLSLREPNYGYGIIQYIKELTGGRLEMGAGTLYGAINTLLEKEWIRLYSEDKKSRKKKEYMITEYGLLALRQEMNRLEELLQNGKRIMHTEEEKKATDENEEAAAAQVYAGTQEERENMSDEKVQIVF